MNIAEVADFFNKTLELDDFSHDPSNNGLQVCGNDQQSCNKIAFAVDASLASIEQAAAAGADMLLVHHGLSWGGEPRRWNGMTGKRFAKLFENHLALYAVHLPLDAHNLYGNNAVLCDLMKLQQRQKFFAYHGMEIGWIGECAEIAPETLAAMAANGKPFKLYSAPQGAEKVRKVAVISGGGGMDGLEAAIDAGADILVTGEFDHTMYHVVQENPVHVIALGHYFSEVHGVQSLQKLATEKLNIDTCFLDIPTGL